MNKKKIVINNVVPFNNGDVALLLSLYEQIRKTGCDVKIATYDYKKAKEFYPELPFFPEIGQHKIFVKIRGLKKILLPLLIFFSKNYREADLVIGTPGGYINSFYNLKNSLSIFKVLKRKGKSTAIYSQSVGPLNKKDSLFFSSLMNYGIDFIYVRDQYSLDNMIKLDISEKKYALSKDLAFILPHVIQNENHNKNKIVIAVREWSKEKRNKLHYIELIQRLVKIAVSEGYKVDFLSTCQGIPDYVDDSIIANKIVETLEPKYKNECTVLSSYYKLEDFLNELNNYDLVVGTRLHMCITSLTKLIPSFNISYEIKGLECYKYLNLQEYSIDYNEEFESAEKSFREFIAKKENIRTHLSTKIPSIQNEIHQDFASFKNRFNL